MGLINKKPEFIAAVCPLCGGNLELDSNFEIARCKDCGAESIIRNVNKKKKKRSSLEVVVDYVERRQDLHRADKREKEKKKEEEQKKAEETIKRYWWVYLLVLFGLFAILITMGILENLGIIS